MAMYLLSINTGKRKKKVLIAQKSSFFLLLIIPYLSGFYKFYGTIQERFQDLRVLGFLTSFSGRQGIPAMIFIRRRLA
jgi:hypothetical protein